MSKNTIWKKYISKYVKDIKANNFYDAFFSVFEAKWELLLQNYDFSNLCQLKNGNRLRPMLVYWGFLLNKRDNELFIYEPNELDRVVDYCVVIETIHKISLLIDDMIDRDVARHGQPTFHTVYGSDTTVLLSVNLLIKSIMDLNIVIQNNPTHGLSDVHLPLETVYEMTKGALLEVSQASEASTDIKTTKKIIELETATIIKNSLVIGYSVGGENNAQIINSLNDVGYCCGYIFQALNDIEPYCNPEELKKHKGAVSIDISNNRKNIVYAYLVNTASDDEINLLKSSEGGSLDLSFINSLITKYKIIELILEEIDNLQSRIEMSIDHILTLSNSKEWCKHFKTFIKLLVEVSSSRAFGD